MTSCSTGGRFSRKLDSPRFQDQKSFVRIIEKDLKEHKYLDVEEGVESFIKNYPVSAYYPTVLLYWSYALIRTSRYSEAVEKIEKMMAASEGHNPLYVAEGYYLLGQCYEGLGKTSEAVSAFLDAELRQEHLLLEVRVAELPARLAAGYLRSGQYKEAQRYYQKAEKGLIKVRRKIKDSNQLARIYYKMGSLGPIKIESKNFENNVRAFEKSQSYLLMSVELKGDYWSPRASDDLIGTYNKIWSAIESVKIDEKNEDQILARLNQQKRQREMASYVISLANYFEVANTPNPKIKIYNRISKVVQNYKEKAELLLVQPTVREENTEAAKKLDALKREGKIKGVGAPFEVKPKLPRRLPGKKEKN